jgi:hypothetical protein
MRWELLRARNGVRPANQLVLVGGTPGSQFLAGPVSCFDLSELSETDVAPPTRPDFNGASPGAVATEPTPSPAPGPRAESHGAVTKEPVSLRPTPDIPQIPPGPVPPPFPAPTVPSITMSTIGVQSTLGLR